MVQHNVPLVRTSFRGRDDALAELAAALDAASVVTVCGPGGAGKTRLALEFAHAHLDRFPAGMWFVDLASVRSAERVVAEVAAPLGVMGGAGDGTDLILEQVGNRPLLLLLDNCEAVIRPVAELVARLVGACGRVRVLCTSREPLGVAAETVVPLDPLSEPDALALFLDRARAADPSFGADPANAAVLAAVVARLDRLPLAIELAAPWVRAVPLADLAGLASRLDIVAATRRDLPARHRTMRATAEWSHDRLNEDQQVLLRRLAALHGTFDLDAVGAP